MKCNWCTQLQQDVRPLVDTLNSIACYNQGEIVTGSFDEPASAEQARQALETFLAKHPECSTTTKRLPPAHTPKKLRDEDK